ncbi:MAG: hypothetical protein ACK40D_09755 [Cyanobacteriota bacterium]|jgi:hypothetical protein
MAYSAGQSPILPVAFFVSTLVAAALVTSDPAWADPVEPFVLPEVVAAVGGDPSFRGVIGYDITLSQSRSLSELGFWDYLGDGLLSSHTVSVLNGSGALLASGVVPSGSTTLLQDGFRWVSIPPIVLSPGRYVIAASLDGEPSMFDEVITDATSITTDVRVSFGPQQALFTAVAPGMPIPVDLLPAVVDGTPGYFGPAIAPGPLPVLGASAGWVWSRRLRARCRHRDSV